MREGEYAVYLRKSRADLEAERRGEGETLARHQAALLDLARRRGLRTAALYREVVSGETIAARPVMQQLLAEVEQGRWRGVLVMEVERLARGDTIDQGIVAQAFRCSGTLIVTPQKTYDPADEFDEEYFEFGLFMSRREYKAINRRLQRGRLASVEEGKFVGTKAPYGYRRRKLERDKGYTLEPVPEQAAVVGLIYEWYIHGGGDTVPMGAGRIAKELDGLQLPSPSGGKWSGATVRDILGNPVYAGRIRWNWRKRVKGSEAGRRTVSRPRQRQEDWVLADGLHPAIIPQALWDAAQAVASRRTAPPVPGGREGKNPLSGLVVCGKCGANMTRRASGGGDAYLVCPGGCGNVSSSLALVEARTVSALERWLDGYRIQPEAEDEGSESCQAEARAAQAALGTIAAQLERLHDLLEQEIYDQETFLTRRQRLEQRRAAAETAVERVQGAGGREEAPPELQTFGQSYAAASPTQRNRLLGELVERIVYTKETSGRWHGAADAFQLVIYPKVGEHPEQGDLERT